MKNKESTLTKNRFLKKIKSKKGMGTVEVVIIIAILVTLSLIFRTTLMGFAQGLMDNAFGDRSIIAFMS